MATDKSERAELFKQFAQRFHAGKSIRRVRADAVAEAESALKVLFPDSFRQFAEECGAVYCPSLPSIQQFLTPKQVVTETRRWRLELPSYAIFASDGSGNWFLFRDLQPEEPRVDDATVWMFDLENGEAVREAASFVEWITRFVMA